MVTQTVTGSVEGGEKLDAYLQKLARRLGAGGTASIGFLEGATYAADDGGLPVAQAAFWNEYGTAGKHPSPPRPYFRNMIEDQAPTWARKLGIAARMTQYRVRPTLEIVAADIKGHLVESINLLQDPPLSEFTIEKKGFPKPLIDTGTMIRAVAWRVVTGPPAKQP